MTPPAHHYLVVSDLHLADIEDHADGWKRHKSSAWVFDDALDRVVQDHEARAADGTLTLVLNGDIFDFDLVTAVPASPSFPVRAAERRYGLDATEAKSAWKLDHILADHPGFVATCGRVVARGGRVVVILGNHDRELFFPAVQAVLREAIGRAAGADPGERLVFEPWFYYVPGEIFIEHGHQYDDYSSFRYNLEPTVTHRGEPEIALSTGNLSNRFLLSNIGYFNPHQTDFILSGWGYVRHWLRHYAFSRRALILTWFFGSLRALLAILATRARLERHPPADYPRHLAAAAERYALPRATIDALYALKKPPITRRLYKIVREYWIDRVVLALAMTGGTIALALSGAALWVKLVVPLIAFPLGWFLYAWAAGSENALTTVNRSNEAAVDIAAIVPVRAVVFGHTHSPGIHPLGRGVMFANTGTWAPMWDAAFRPVQGYRNWVWVRVAPGADPGDTCHVAVGSAT